MSLTFVNKIFAVNGFSFIDSSFDSDGNEDYVHFEHNGIFVEITNIAPNDEETSILIKADYKEITSAGSKSLKKWKINGSAELEQYIILIILGMGYAKNKDLRVYRNAIY